MQGKPPVESSRARLYRRKNNQTNWGNLITWDFPPPYKKEERGTVFNMEIIMKVLEYQAVAHRILSQLILFLFKECIWGLGC